ncbi:voltage-gated potassium channel [Sulfobacillus thermosulfidooxidans DSM 9293]|uniref:Voltage-gated potassium channel n=2 Tax=Sulfobacillus thermosulfidooxidans TaxID=28034 RepID=A0A1W1WLR5_SULTA|nr:potassium channel protein [Sulfobacillus thermosulfidooxidans]PSR29790.1 MAG: potassium channel protein [Sulfobacillus thermosulfidooxidans]SMC07196.1 voltage-gated potassium channel [Sulfobacillus thermosulfidooxidans DSM 9293]
MQTFSTRVKWALGLIAAVLTLGTVGFHQIYHVNWLLAFYFIIAIMSTVSDSRITPHGTLQLVFNAIIIIIGTGVWIFGLSLIVSYFLESDLGHFKERRTMREIERMINHFVVIGAGRVGESIARELVDLGETVVILDPDPTRIERIRNSGLPALTINGFNADALNLAHLVKARGIALALPDDAQNLYAYLTARDINPHLQVVARAQTQESAHYLKNLGVDRIILPDLITGRRLARMLAKPVAQDLLMALLNEEGVHVQEIYVNDHDPIANQPVQNIRDIYGEAVTLIGYWHEGKLHMAPRAQDIIVPGDTVILVQVDET